MAKKGEKWLWQSPANFITISRVPLGIGVYYFLANHNISTALALFALGVIADTVDTTPKSENKRVKSVRRVVIFFNIQNGGQ